MNNETIHEYKIKLRGDKVYDIYLDGNFMSSKGSINSAVDELKIIMCEADGYLINKIKKPLL